MCWFRSRPSIKMTPIVGVVSEQSGPVVPTPEHYHWPILGELLMAAMSEPLYFCGHPPIMHLAEFQTKRNFQCRWWVDGDLPGFERFDLRLAVAQAMNAWSEVSGVNHEEAMLLTDADLVIATGRIDGPSKILAWCELPGPKVQHSMIDASEPWVIQLGTQVPRNKIDLERVLRHEFGHFWGLDHSPQGSGNLMDPTYSLKIDGPRPGDIQRMVALYGSPRVPMPPPGGDEPDQMIILGKSGKETARFKLTRI